MNSIKVAKYPPCYACGSDAEYDGMMLNGRWAYICSSCLNGVETLQITKLSVTKQVSIPEPKKIKSVRVPLTLDSIAYIECPYCKEERAVEPDATYEIACDSCGYDYYAISWM